MRGKTSLHRAETLSHAEWEDVQALELESWSSLPRVDREVAEGIVHAGNLEAFIAARADPSSLVGTGHHENQSYDNPRIVAHKVAGKLNGVLYVVNNVSGETQEEREKKQRLVVPNYLKMSEIAVKPEARRKGIARKMARRALLSANPVQRVSTYVIREYTPELEETLERYGFKYTGEEPYEIYEDGPVTTQVRMQARSVLGLIWQTSKPRIGK